MSGSGEQRNTGGNVSDKVNAFNKGINGVPLNRDGTTSDLSGVDVKGKVEKIELSVAQENLINHLKKLLSGNNTEEIQQLLDIVIISEEPPKGIRFSHQYKEDTSFLGIGLKFIGVRKLTDEIKLLLQHLNDYRGDAVSNSDANGEPYSILKKAKELAGELQTNLKDGATEKQLNNFVSDAIKIIEDNKANLSQGKQKTKETEEFKEESKVEISKITEPKTPTLLGPEEVQAFESGEEVKVEEGTIDISSAEQKMDLQKNPELTILDGPSKGAAEQKKMEESKVEISTISEKDAAELAKAIQKEKESLSQKLTKINIDGLGGNFGTNLETIKNNIDTARNKEDFENITKDINNLKETATGMKSKEITETRFEKAKQALAAVDLIKPYEQHFTGNQSEEKVEKQSLEELSEALKKSIKIMDEKNNDQIAALNISSVRGDITKAEIEINKIFEIAKTQANELLNDLKTTCPIDKDPREDKQFKNIADELDRIIKYEADNIENQAKVIQMFSKGDFAKRIEEAKAEFKKDILAKLAEIKQKAVAAISDEKISKAAKEYLTDNLKKSYEYLKEIIEVVGNFPDVTQGETPNELLETLKKYQTNLEIIETAVKLAKAKALAFEAEKTKVITALPNEYKENINNAKDDKELNEKLITSLADLNKQIKTNNETAKELETKLDKINKPNKHAETGLAAAKKAKEPPKPELEQKADDNTNLITQINGADAHIKMQYENIEIAQTNLALCKKSEKESALQTIITAIQSTKEENILNNIITNSSPDENVDACTRCLKENFDTLYETIDLAITSAEDVKKIQEAAIQALGNLAKKAKPVDEAKEAKEDLNQKDVFDEAKKALQSINIIIPIKLAEKKGIEPPPEYGNLITIRNELTNLLRIYDYNLESLTDIHNKTEEANTEIVNLFNKTKEKAEPLINDSIAKYPKSYTSNLDGKPSLEQIINDRNELENLVKPAKLENLVKNEKSNIIIQKATFIKRFSDGEFDTNIKNAYEEFKEHIGKELNKIKKTAENAFKNLNAETKESLNSNGKFQEAYAALVTSPTMLGEFSGVNEAKDPTGLSDILKQHQKNLETIKTSIYPALTKKIADNIKEAKELEGKLGEIPDVGIRTIWMEAIIEAKKTYNPDQELLEAKGIEDVNKNLSAQILATNDHIKMQNENIEKAKSILKKYEKDTALEKIIESIKKQDNKEALTEIVDKSNTEGLEVKDEGDGEFAALKESLKNNNIATDYEIALAIKTPDDVEKIHVAATKALTELKEKKQAEAEDEKSYDTGGIFNFNKDTIKNAIRNEDNNKILSDIAINADNENNFVENIKKLKFNDFNSFDEGECKNIYNDEIQRKEIQSCAAAQLIINSLKEENHDDISELLDRIKNIEDIDALKRLLNHQKKFDHPSYPYIIEKISQDDDLERIKKAADEILTAGYGTALLFDDAEKAAEAADAKRKPAEEAKKAAEEAAEKLAAEKLAEEEAKKSAEAAKTPEEKIKDAYYSLEDLAGLKTLLGKLDKATLDKIFTDPALAAATTIPQIKSQLAIHMVAEKIATGEFKEFKDGIANEKDLEAFSEFKKKEPSGPEAKAEFIQCCKAYDTLYEIGYAKAMATQNDKERKQLIDAASIAIKEKVMPELMAKACDAKTTAEDKVILLKLYLRFQKLDEQIHNQKYQLNASKYFTPFPPERYANQNNGDEAIKNILETMDLEYNNNFKIQHKVKPAEKGIFLNQIPDNNENGLGIIDITGVTILVYPPTTYLESIPGGDQEREKAIKETSVFYETLGPGPYSLRVIKPADKSEPKYDQEIDWLNAFVKHQIAECDKIKQKEKPGTPKYITADNDAIYLRTFKKDCLDKITHKENDSKAIKAATDVLNKKFTPNKFMATKAVDSFKEFTKKERGFEDPKIWLQSAFEHSIKDEQGKPSPPVTITINGKENKEIAVNLYILLKQNPKYEGIIFNPKTIKDFKLDKAYADFLKEQAKEEARKVKKFPDAKRNSYTDDQAMLAGIERTKVVESKEDYNSKVKFKHEGIKEDFNKLLRVLRDPNNLSTPLLDFRTKIKNLCDIYNNSPDNDKPKALKDIRDQLKKHSRAAEFDEIKNLDDLTDKLFTIKDDLYSQEDVNKFVAALQTAASSKLDLGTTKVNKVEDGGELSVLPPRGGP